MNVLPVGKYSPAVLHSDNKNEGESHEISPCAGGGFVACGLLCADLAQATLSYTTREDVLFVWGKAESSDVDKFEAKLTPAISTVVLWAPTGDDWALARQLAGPIEKAQVTTVAQGACASYTCAMMFLSGKERMFSGAGRPETHYVSLSFWETGYFVTTDKTSMSTVVEWWKEHTRLSSGDLRPYHESILYTPRDYRHDSKVFLPATANISSGQVLHCSGEKLQKGLTQYFQECMVDSGASALSKGIVTTDELFSHPYIAVKADMAVPPASNYAQLEDAPATPRILDSCQKQYENFLKQDSPRAFVLSESGSCAWRGAQTSRPYAQAMDACRGIQNGGACRFYAVDDKVVFVPFEKALKPAAATSAPASASATEPKRPL